MPEKRSAIVATFNTHTEAESSVDEVEQIRTIVATAKDIETMVHHDLKSQ